MKKRIRRIFVVATVGIVALAIYSQVGSKDESGTGAVNRAPVVPSVENKEDLTPQAIYDSKKVAESFARAFTEMDAKHPEDYLVKIKPYTSPGLYHRFSDQPRRPLAGELLKKVVAVKTFPVDNKNPDHKEWNVIVTVETTKEKGQKYKEEISYWLLLNKNRDKWQVEGVDVGVDAE